MIDRYVANVVLKRLEYVPVVAILGARQVGKTTLARMLGSRESSIYLDLEAAADRSRLTEPRLYLQKHTDKLIILDEVQHMPGLFRELRGLIDEARFAGVGPDGRSRRSARFLVLGSASGDLLRQSGESLAGRIAYVELAPFSLLELEGRTTIDDLWLRGGFPESVFSPDEKKSVTWRYDFIRTFLERDIREITPRIPAETLRRLWTMIAHASGSLLNAAEFARALAVDGKTVSRYIDLLSDLFMVYRLPPWHGNTRKRLVKSPRIFVSDTGILHTLLGIDTFDALLSHPVAGASWECFVIQQIRSVLPERAGLYFYRSAGGAEIDIVLVLANGEQWAIEVKRTLNPKIERGFIEACGEVKPSRHYICYAGEERFPLGRKVDAIGVSGLMREIVGARKPGKGCAGQF